jgi:hypothetical protein
MEFSPLMIKFGVVKGHGYDAVGEFDINGYHGGKSIKFIKKYIGQHSVLYDGHISKDGKKASGEWHIEGMSGGFELNLA